MSDDLDPLALLTRYAPTQATLSSQWDELRPADLVERAVAANDADAVVPLAPRTRPRARRVLPLPAAASVAALFVAVGALVFALVSPDGPSRTAPGHQHGRYITPPPGLSGEPLGAHQYAYSVTRSTTTEDGTGAPVPGRLQGTTRTATFPDLSAVGLDSTGNPTVCIQSESAGRPDAGSAGGSQLLTHATRSFLLTLPTDYRALGRYLTRHAPRPMTVATSITGLFRRSDGLASPRLRAALLAVLSRQPHVTTDWTATDDLDRPALRFTVDEGDATRVLYFDPRDFHQLESRFEYDGTTQRTITVKFRVADDGPAIRKLCSKKPH